MLITRCLLALCFFLFLFSQGRPVFALNAAEKAGVTFAVPKNWTVGPVQEGGDASIALEVPKNFPAQGNIVITLFTVKKDLSQLAAERQQDWIYYDGYRVLDSTRHNIGADHRMAAIDRTIAYTMGLNFNYKVRFLYFGKPGRIYCFRLFADPNSFTAMNEQLEHIIATVRVLPSYSLDITQKARTANLPKDGKAALTPRDFDTFWPAADARADIVWLNRSKAVKMLDESNRAMNSNKNFPASLQMVAALLRRAIAYACLHQWKEANADLIEAKKLRPGDLSVYKAIALAHCILRDKHRALDAADVALQLAPDDAQCHLAKAYGFHLGTNTEGTIGEAEKCIKLNPHCGLPYSLRAIANWRFEEGPRIEKDFLQAVKIEPKSALTHYMAGRYYTEGKRLPEALAQFSEAIKLDPNSDMSYYWRAVVYEHMKDYAKAKNDLTQTLLLYPAFEPAFALRANVELKEGDLDACLADCAQADKHGQNDVLVYFTRAQAYLEAKKLQPALREVNRLIRKYPNNTGAFQLRAKIHQAMGRADLSSEDLSECMQVQATDRFYGGGKKALAIYLERFRGLLKSYDQVIALNPRDGDARYNRAVAYLCLGQFPQAQEDLRQFMKIAQWKGTSAANAAILLNFAYRLDHKDKEAKAILDEATAKISNHNFPYPVIQFLKGEISEGDAFLTAMDRDQVFAALSYLGIGQSLNGHIQEAMWDLTKVKDQGDARSDDYYLGLAQLDRMSNTNQAGRSNR